MDCGVFMAGLVGYCWDRLFQITKGALCHRIANTSIQLTSKERGSMLSFINDAEPPQPVKEWKNKVQHRDSELWIQPCVVTADKLHENTTEIYE